MSFNVDLKRGQCWEDELFNYASANLSLPVVKSEVSQQLKHGGDFMITTEEGVFHVECKHDYAAKRTGNLYLEVEVSYPDKPLIQGWVYKLPTNCLVVWKVDEGEYYAMNELEVLEAAVANYKRASFTSKIPNSKGVLLPKSTLTKLNSLDEILGVIKDEIECMNMLLWG